MSGTTGQLKIGGGTKRHFRSALKDREGRGWSISLSVGVTRISWVVEKPQRHRENRKKKKERQEFLRYSFSKRISTLNANKNGKEKVGGKEIKSVLSGALGGWKA